MRTIEEILKSTSYDITKMEYFLAECFMDYLFFAEHVLGFEIADYHKEWYNLKEIFKRLCIIAFRGSGKTHFFAGYYIWKAIFHEKTEILIISNTLEQAKYVLKIIRTMFMENEILKQFIPQTRDVTWKATELTLVNGSIFYCKPYNENVRSIHPDEIMCDEAGEYVDKTIFWTAIMGAIQLKMGKVIVDGTPKSTIDLLAELKKNDEFMVKEYPAELNGQPLWPQKYTMLEHDTATKRSLVQIKKEIGELPYTQEFLLTPISSANSIFPFEIINKSLSDNEKFIPFGKKNERYYVGYDIAISPKGDYTVITVLGVNADRKKLVYALRFRDSFEEQKRRIRRIIEDFQPQKIAVDATGLGEQQAKELKNEFGNIIEPKKITYDEKYKMIMDLRQEFERLRMVLPNSKEDIKTYSFTQTLIKELNDFTLQVDLRQSSRPKFRSGQYDDTVMSLALANWASQASYGIVSIRAL